MTGLWIRSPVLADRPILLVSLVDTVADFAFADWLRCFEEQVFCSHSVKLTSQISPMALPGPARNNFTQILNFKSDFKITNHAQHAHCLQ